MACAWPSVVLLSFLFAGSPDAGSPASGREWIDAIVATVGGEPIFLSEIELEARVAIIEQGGTLAAHAPLAADDLAAALEWAVDQRLVLAEAERLRVFNVDDAEVAKAIKAFQARFPDEKAMRAFLDSQEATEDELAAVLRRELRVARFLESRQRHAARAVEQEVQRALSSGGPDGGSEREAVKVELVRARELMRERYRALTRKELDELRAKADVRIASQVVQGRRGDGDGTNAPP